ncbi:hypothetical protein [Flavisphingopyxis soli]|uniref:hypothetical protein n=1 Tax=Flavisphingopyxis soli TaxID=2601267 RepID=UPI001F2A51CD|nr:hypothetical protein [Sphingorhabdus soli]
MDSKQPPAATGTKPIPRWKIVTLAILALLIALIVWQYPGLKAQAEAGSAYGARVGCSCRYVENRELGNCESDFEPGMAMVSLSDDPETRTVTASVPLLGSASAHYAGLSGCILDRED